MKDLALAKLQALNTNASLPHAWLFTGPDTNYKLQIANTFSQWLLCTNRQGNIACGTCKSCQLFSAGTHTDFCVITPQEDSTTIVIDDVRRLNDFITGKPQFSSKKIVLLYPAEKMNKQAANALLKNLEEPGPDTVLLLLSQHQDLLLKTIVSRCQMLPFAATNSAVNIDPQVIAQLVKDLIAVWVNKTVTPIQLVEQWVKQWPHEVLYCLELVLCDAMVCKYTQDANLLRYPALQAEQAVLVNAIPESKLWAVVDSVQQARTWVGRGHKPNLQLILENIVLQIM